MLHWLIRFYQKSCISYCLLRHSVQNYQNGNKVEKKIETCVQYIIYIICRGQQKIRPANAPIINFSSYLSNLISTLSSLLLSPTVIRTVIQNQKQNAKGKSKIVFVTQFSTETTISQPLHSFFLNKKYISLYPEKLHRKPYQI